MHFQPPAHKLKHASSNSGGSVISTGFSFDQITNNNPISHTNIEPVNSQPVCDLSATNLNQPKDLFKSSKQQEDKDAVKVNKDSSNVVQPKIESPNFSLHNITRHNPISHTDIEAINVPPVSNLSATNLNQPKDLFKSSKRQENKDAVKVNKDSSKLIQPKMESPNFSLHNITHHNPISHTDIEAVNVPPVCNLSATKMNQPKDLFKSSKQQEDKDAVKVNKDSLNVVQPKIESPNFSLHNITHLNPISHTDNKAVTLNKESIAELRQQESMKTEMSHLTDSLIGKLFAIGSNVETIKEQNTSTKGEISRLKNEFMEKLDKVKEVKEEIKFVKTEILQLKNAFDQKFDTLKFDIIKGLKEENIHVKRETSSYLKYRFFEENNGIESYSDIIEELKEEIASIKREMSHLQILFNKKTSHIIHYKENILQNINELILNNIALMQSKVNEINVDRFDYKSLKDEIISMKEEIAQLKHASIEITPEFIEFKNKILKNGKEDSLVEEENNNKMVPRRNLDYIKIGSSLLLILISICFFYLLDLDQII